MDEENFDEAIANVRYAWTDTGAVTKEVEEIIRDERARALTLESDKFWFLAAALREFVDREGCLPLEGSIPDMTSTTESYVESCSVCTRTRRLETPRACGRAPRRSLATSARRIPKSSFPSATPKSSAKTVDTCDS